ncbi:succinyldiaminopimelate transaminase [Helicobacter anseris]|uniref:Succinyldiaminopimelate transaminase n=1 Tax=Helicobacter anseris TaxID=375926 RepID=A0A3D8J8Z8_9HELI|nr:succinyldiaminopimelate transaminase [Helicobacter anseris]RDU73987.1 succinyldiaminopimelate transaminase [Helicobacter anseris]
MLFQPYPFEKLQELIKDIRPNKPLFKLTIGEPQFPTPQNIQDAFKESSELLRFYPSTKGESYLYESIQDFLSYRYNLNLDSKQIIPTLGTREVLFNFPQFLLSEITHPTMAYPNPFYQVYEGASIASKSKVFLMELNQDNNFKPSLSIEQMKQVNLVILNSPNNPTGATLSKEELKQWVQYALEYDFVLLNDECYSEIYQDTPPAGILEASYELGNKDFKNILSINSISKRLSAPSLRSGFIAGDAEILKNYLTYRTYLGVAMPTPLQKTASIAWKSHKIAQEIRKKYADNLKLAQQIFTTTPIYPFSFYVWLYVRDELSFCKKLYEKEGILVLPGSFLGRNNAGKGYVRIALVYDTPTLKPILETIATFLQKGEF